MDLPWPPPVAATWVRFLLHDTTVFTTGVVPVSHNPEEVLSRHPPPHPRQAAYSHKITTKTQIW